MNDTDIQHNDAIRTACNMRKARLTKGVCFHNYIKGALCLDCNKQFASDEDLNDERRELIIEWC